MELVVAIGRCDVNIPPPKLWTTYRLKRRAADITPVPDDWNRHGKNAYRTSKNAALFTGL
jgi:hypothetical protein